MPVYAVFLKVTRTARADVVVEASGEDEAAGIALELIKEAVETLDYSNEAEAYQVAQLPPDLEKKYMDSKAEVMATLAEKQASRAKTVLN